MRSFIILTQYYPPETGAPQNRLHSLSTFLRAKGYSVTVVTALPNYPKSKIFDSYKGRLSMRENIDGIPIYRSWIFVSSSRGIISRLLNYVSFTVTAFFNLLRLPQPDWILCESPPLFLGITAVVVAKIRRAKLIFNVSDLWPESAEKLKIVSNKFLLKTAYRLETWIYKNSYLISGQTKGIVSSINTRFPGKRVIWLPNGVDHSFLNADHQEKDWRTALGVSASDFVILYAGVIGHAQGLEVILRASARLPKDKFKFLIVGDGPERKPLESLATKMKLTNVHFLDNLERVWIPSLIQSCDVYIVPLRKLDLFMGAIPSKLFEPLALGKPILLGVDGEARDLFIKEGKCGLYFEPENDADLAKQINILFRDTEMRKGLGIKGRDYVVKNFDRTAIYERFLESLS